MMATESSPLDGMKMGIATTIAIRELPGLHTLDLRVAPGTPAEVAIAKTLGVALPGKPGQTSVLHVSGGGEAHALCLGPDWWLLTGFREAAQRLEFLKNNHHFSAVEVSSQRTTIELEGPKVSAVLAQLWEQDLREKSFPVTSVSQGLMAKAPVIVWHVDRNRYRVMVRSSFALHVWKTLTDATQEWI